jgi:TldD protein
MRADLLPVLDYLRQRGAAYADLRLTDRRTQSLTVKNGSVEAATESRQRGFGIRVLTSGAWGFAASSSQDPSEMRRIGDLALAIARASATVRGQPVQLAAVEPVVDSWQADYRRDPFDVSLPEVTEVLLDAEQRLHVAPEIRIGEAYFSAMREHKTFASTEGAYIEQEITECGGGVSATAVRGGEVQQRGYPNSHRGGFSSQGYEYFAGLDLPGHAAQCGSEALQLVEAEQCPSDVRDLILDSRQLALQIHESCGHPVELDRVLGAEAAFAGTSFLTPEKRGTFRYGSPEITLVADGCLPTGLGTQKYDDEGVPTGRTVLVDRGIFVNYLTSRETALANGDDRSGGTMRADGYNRIPLIRMNNINLEPGDWTLEELIRDTKRGLLLDTNRSWSIDDRRLNFQFGTEIGWEIVDGALGRVVRNPNYTGMTPEFWGSCDAVCNRDHWQLWGTPNCGKGEPTQVAHVGHGSAPARFRDVRVGVGYGR